MDCGRCWRRKEAKPNQRKIDTPPSNNCLSHIRPKIVIIRLIVESKLSRHYLEIELEAVVLLLIYLESEF
jgi:hypothetical protein